mmetsp:Transcript_32788/g.79452  ORF Transcript_32788/g.79452 Transcript_32788/m.79452 type:complete len:260 (-) Transcript_32788:171-950(-)|eukprot:CAMPEP_0113643956 /NCGR_PEP_ID=MMETSP0017_2-20120614/23125_1 /TAXON_ID=2856 /ORGANISM="Cylindrotheca closterium" /LENGTH=259 /DNA_ID=CAMNT_0000555523 /DNA_START=66 /DNA_END=845 /DNA_ORIENTATION=- /assembly_acc=CAM_ASM_000147
MLESTFISSMLTRSPSGRKERRETIPKRKKSQQRRKETGKKISFDPRVQYHPIPYVSDVEKGGVWYSGADYAAAREREEFIRKSVSENDALFKKNEENLNAQGIMTNQEVLQKIDSIDSSVLVVLEEQDEQEVKFHISKKKNKKSKNKKRGQGDDGPSVFSVNAEKIARVYRSHSQQSLKEAHNRALRHRKHLKEIAGDPSIPSPSFSPGRALKKATSRRLPKVPKVPSVVTIKNPLVGTRRQIIDTVPRASRCTNPAA